MHPFKPYNDTFPENSLKNVCAFIMRKGTFEKLPEGKTPLDGVEYTVGCGKPADDPIHKVEK